jgi:anaerobic magnesium-protoporphyrin IX monomethyl ester cyclase
MRCALVIPSWVPEDIFSSKTAASQINYWQPLGTLYVAAMLRQAGHEVIFVNGAFRRHEQLLSDIRSFNPGFIGVYSTTFGWNKAKITASAVRKMFDNVFICAGGPYPIALQEKCLQDSGQLFDAIVTGEGEQTCLEMVARLESG